MEKKTESQKQLGASASIRLDGGAVSGNAVPAAVLAQTITGLQQLVFLMGADSEKFDINERLKFSAQHREDFTLMCEPPSQGSFIQNLHLKSEKVQGVFTNVVALMAATASGDQAAAKTLVKNSILRRRTFQTMRSLLPKEDDGVTLEFAHGGQTVSVSGKEQKIIAKWIQEVSTESATTMTVKGVLVKANFENHWVAIKYAPNNKEILCKYLPEIEDNLLNARKTASGLIEVTGEFTLDNKGFPKKLNNVFSIEPVSLDAIKLNQLKWKQRVFEFIPPMEFTPSLDTDTQQLYVIEDASLGVNVFSETREGLLQELSEQVAMLWDEYADEEDENLADDALAVAKKLRQAIKQAGNA